MEDSNYIPAGNLSTRNSVSDRPASVHEHNGFDSNHHHNNDRSTYYSAHLADTAPFDVAAFLDYLATIDNDNGNSA